MDPASLMGANVALIAAISVVQGLVLAPGFIDTHYHGTLPIHYRLALRNGVTSIMDLEFGTLGDEVGAWYEERTAHRSSILGPRPATS